MKAASLLYICISLNSKYTYRHLFLLVFTWSFLQIAAAQVKFSVIPSKTMVAKDESFQVQFVVEGATAVDEIKAPSFRNFEQLSGLDQSNGWTWVNGTLSEYVSFTILLRPKIKGKLPIASAVVKVKGKLLTSSPIVIYVTDAGKANNPLPETEEKPDYYLMPGEQLKDKIANNLFIRATIDQHSCYVGQPILATFKLFTRLDSESKVVKRPSLNGFSVIDLEQPEAGIFSKEMYKGKMYNCYLIRKVQLFPLQSGEIKIEPVEIENTVRMIKVKPGANKESSSWLDAMMEKMKEAEVNSDDIIQEKVLLKSEELSVHVNELPEKNKPESFNGAVGHFTMEASLLNNTIAANDNATLRVTIRGTGNIPMITAPVINWPTGVDSFEAKLNEDIDHSTIPISGVKTFDIPFAVTKTGLFHVPTVRFSYFDEKTKQYETLTADSLNLQVTAAVQRKPVVDKNHSTTEGLSRTARLGLIGGAGGLAILVVGIFFFVSRKKQEEKSPVITEAIQEPVIRKTVAAFLQPAIYVQDGLHEKQFYSLLMQGLQQFYYDRFDIAASFYSNQKIADLLHQKNCADLAEQFQSIISGCEMVLFSAVTMGDSKEQLLQESIELMNASDQRLFTV